MNPPPATGRLDSKNLLIPVVLAFMAGITWARFGVTLPEPANLLAILVVAAALLLTWRRANAYYIYPLLVIFFFLTGIFHAGPDRPPPTPFHIYNLIKHQQEGTIQGRLRQTIRTDLSNKHRLIIDAEQLILPDQSRPATGLVQLTSKEPPPINLLPGDRLLVKATLNRPHSFATPGAFNYQQYLADQSIRITGWIRSPAHILKISEAPSEAKTPWQYLPERLRHQISLAIDPLLDDKVRGLYKAILIGERGDIPPDQTDDFNASGLTHLLSISGMHMSMLALLVILMFTWLLRQSTWILLHTRAPKLAAALSFPALIGYALITGLDPPVVRAFVMTAVFLLAIMIDRQNNVAGNIALAAFLLLIWQPTSLFSVSFQLSFAAVTAICLTLPLLRLEKDSPAPKETDTAKRLKRLQKLFWAGILISIVAMLGTAPLTIFHFNRFSPISPLTTLLAAPLMCYWSLPIGLIALLVLPIAPSLAAQLFSIGSWGITATSSLAHFAGQLPISSVWLPTPSIFEVVLWYIFLLALLGWQTKKACRLLALLSLIAALSIPLIIAHNRLQATDTVVTYLDVGQGSATLLELPNAKTILIDGGGAFTERFNVGQGVIAPFLWQKRITGLDAIVLTHLHSDHYSGLPFIVARFKPETLWINGELPFDQLFAALMQETRANNVRTAIPKAKEFLFADGPVSLQVISDLHLQGSQPNPENQSQKTGSNANESSLVLKLRHGETSFLFPGDIESGDEQLLLNKEVDVHADVLLAPHHGRATSSSEEFIEKVAPRYVVLSTSPFAKSERLTSDAIQKYQAAGTTVFTTARDGAITFRTDGKTIKSQKTNE